MKSQHALLGLCQDFQINQGDVTKIIMTNDKYKACQDEGLVVVVKK